MKIAAYLISLAGLLTLGACNTPNAAVTPRAEAASAPRVGPAKIVGYSTDPASTPGYGEGLGDAGGGGHHH